MIRRTLLTLVADSDMPVVINTLVLRHLHLDLIHCYKIVLGVIAIIFLDIFF